MTASTHVRRLYRMKHLVEATDYSDDTIRRAIKATDPTRFPPPLEAGKDARGYFVLPHDLDAWLEAIKQQNPA